MSAASPIAAAIADLTSELLGGELPLQVRAWDGSTAGPTGGPVLRLDRPSALRRLLWAPGELGLARAYVSGDLEVDGDLTDALRRVRAASGPRGGAPRPTPRLLASAARTLLRVGAIGRPPPRPRSELRLRGRVHSRRRDRQAIAHHYDLSNALYTLLLGDSVAYSCGYWTSDAPDYGLDDAQRDKLDLICRKLDLRPGLRLLDVGCGWGALAVHAARHYGAQVVGVTLSAQQLAFGRERVAREGLDALVDLRLQDYRDLPPTDTFDTVTAIEMGEHVGKDNYPSFLARLHAACRPGGRLLVQQMSRSGQHPGGGPFIERYIAPDMYMRPIAETLQLISTAGFEVRDVHAMREHYVRTIRAWLEIFENRLDDVVSLVGPEQARVWRLYLAGGALAFEANRMGVDQILAVRTPADGGRGVPTTRREWEPVGAAESVEQ